MFIQLRILLVKLALNLSVLLLITLFGGIWFDKVLWVFGPTIGLVLLNAFLPLLILLFGFDLNLPTLAVFTALANSALVMSLKWLIPAFHIVGLWSTIGGLSIVVAANFGFNWYFYRQEIHFRESFRHRGSDAQG